MEFLEGEDLLTVLKREGPFSEDRACNLASQILAALGAAHDLNLIHRDLKPANVMVTQRRNDDGDVVEFAKVCDFGLAKMTQEADMDAPSTQGTVVGTPLYMSPEQATGQPLDPQTDVYSCGVMLYHMLAGKPPFLARNHMAILMKHVTEKPPPIARQREDLSPRLESVIYWALDKTPSNRPTARQLRKALREISRGASPQVPNPQSYTGEIAIPETLDGPDAEPQPLPLDALIEVDTHSTPVLSEDAGAQTKSDAPVIASAEPGSSTEDLMAAVIEEAVGDKPAKVLHRGEVGNVASTDIDYSGPAAVLGGDIKAHLWRAYSVMFTPEKGQYAFSIRDPHKALLTPLSWHDARAVLARLGERGQLGDASISSDGHNWLVASKFARLAGLDGILLKATEPLPRARIGGDLKNASTIAVFAAVAKERPSGRLALQRVDLGQTVRIEIHLVRGRPTTVSISKPELQLPDLVVAQKLATEELLPSLMADVLASETPFAEAVAKASFVDMEPYLKGFMRDRIYEAFQWISGDFWLDEEAMPASASPIAPSLLSFVPEMIGRARDESSLHRALEPYLHKKLARSQRFNQVLGDMRPTAQQVRILERFGGRRTIGEALLNQNPARVYMAWAHLLIEAGLLIEPR